ncbi:hypothetical protein ACJZ2D_008858 [Fusarium nematophilum]
MPSENGRATSTPFQELQLDIQIQSHKEHGAQPAHRGSPPHPGAVSPGCSRRSSGVGATPVVALRVCGIRAVVAQPIVDVAARVRPVKIRPGELR